jgi:hypothetical protein
VAASMQTRLCMVVQARSQHGWYQFFCSSFYSKFATKHIHGTCSNCTLWVKDKEKQDSQPVYILVFNKRDVVECKEDLLKASS